MLYPGFSAGQPLAPSAFGARLLVTDHPLASRNTARLTLAADPAAAVLADVVGIHSTTATWWAQRTNRD